MELICKVVEKIVFSGIDGTILILPMLVLLYVLAGQAKDCVDVIRRTWREERKERVH